MGVCLSVRCAKRLPIFSTPPPRGCLTIDAGLANAKCYNFDDRTCGSSGTPISNYDDMTLKGFACVDSTLRAKAENVSGLSHAVTNKVQLYTSGSATKSITFNTSKYKEHY